MGGQIGTTGIFVMRKAEAGADIKEYDDVGLAIQDLVGGRIDAVICDDPVATNYILENAEYGKKMKVALIVPADVPEYYGFAVHKGDKELLELLNKGIAAVKEKGIEKELIKKWMGQ